MLEEKYGRYGVEETRQETKEEVYQKYCEQKNRTDVQATGIFSELSKRTPGHDGHQQ